MYVVGAFIVILLFLHFDLSEIIASAHTTYISCPLQKHAHYPCFTLHLQNIVYIPAQKVHVEKIFWTLSHMRPQTVSVLFQYLPCSFQAWSQPQIHTFFIAIFTDQKYLIPSFCSPHESSCILFHSSHPCQVQRLFKEEKQYYHRRNYTKVDPLTQRLVFNEGKNRDIPHWASQKTNWNIKSQIMQDQRIM